MFSNPFSPIFGGKPDVFFGREKVINHFEHAMIDVGSDDRAIFITGTRGSGKTALLEQLSIKAAAQKRKVISIMGIRGGISVGSVSKTERVGRENLQQLLLEACSTYKNGIMITVDEIQKIPLEDVSSLCNAFQMASRKGCDIMLAVAGLPYAYSSVIKHEGCTYLRRATHEELGLFTWEETEGAYKSVFSGIKGLSITSAMIEKLNEACYGHPYIMQLLGYYLILYINDHDSGKKHSVTEDEIKAATENALYAYEQRALKPLIDELPNSERSYLVKMSECLNSDRLAETSDIASGLGVSSAKLSRPRAHLIDQGIIAAPERGKVMFCIPYLADYVKKDEHISDVISVARQRRV